MFWQQNRDIKMTKEFYFGGGGGGGGSESNSYETWRNAKKNFDYCSERESKKR